MYYRSKFSILAFIVLILWIKSSQQQQSLEENDDPDYTFEDFVRQYDRGYTKGTQQYKNREKIFYKNYQLIKQKEADCQASTSQIQCHYGVNKFADKTKQQIQEMNNFQMNNFDEFQAQQEPKQLRSSLGSNYPNSLDYRVLKKVTSVKDQKQCGSCWAFSTIALYQSLISIVSNLLLDLSEQYVLQCTQKSRKCQGGIPKFALDMFTPNGVPSDSQYPYQNSAYYYPQSQICSAENKHKLAAQITKIKHYSSVTDSQLKQILYRYGPVSIGLYAQSSQLTFYRSGVYSKCPSDAAERKNHAVLLVGYTESGDWIIKNSWGTDWGEDGYGIIDRRRDCGIKSYVDAVELENDVPYYLGGSNTQTIKYTMYLTDNYGDGWNGNQWGLTQKGQPTQYIGSKFQNGSSYGPITLSVIPNLTVSIIATTHKQWTQQIGCKIYDSSNKLIFERKPSKYNPDTIITSWCPGTCQQQQQKQKQILIYVSMTDKYGDGWNQIVLGLKSDGKIIGIFGEQFTSGYTSKTNLTIKTNTKISIVVSKLGSWHKQIGFTISYYNQDKGKLQQIFKWQPGNIFHADTILGTFCIDCSSDTSVSMASSNLQAIQDNKNQNIQNENIVQNIQEISENKQQTKYIISMNAFIISVLAILSFIPLALIIGACYIIITKCKQVNRVRNTQETENNIKMNSNQNQA